MKLKLLSILGFFILVGCNQPKVEDAASGLEVGMTKAELDQLFSGIEVIKEQIVSMYPNASDEKMRGILYSRATRSEGGFYPENIFHAITFDGDIKTYAYLVKRKQPFANPVHIDYLAVFYSQKNDQVVGWGYFGAGGDPEGWSEKF
jgi:hypothetical protein